MRRQDIQLLAAARRGDIDAQCEAGRRYLAGADGFPQHTQTGLDYLLHASVRDLSMALKLIADTLPLHELLSRDLLVELTRAADLGNTVALAKLGAWLLTMPQERTHGKERLRIAAAGTAATLAVDVAESEHGALDLADPDPVIFANLSARGVIDGVEVLVLALRAAHKARDLARMIRCLQLAASWHKTRLADLAESVVDVVALAERLNLTIDGVDVEFVDAALAMRAARGDMRAVYILGRGLSGIPCGVMEPQTLVPGSNLRKGTAMLLRAADGGEAGAWLHLYHISADHRCSVANPQMARFFLEKAAAEGSAVAQRKLGALQLRESETLPGNEQALSWLHQAGAQGDDLAQRLLRTLVLPIGGNERDATDALQVVGRTDPFLAARLSVSRQFGLTKHEALALNPASGARPWGLVVGTNPFIRQSRLAAGRAVPSLSSTATSTLRAAASLFSRNEHDARLREGDLRHRARLVRTLFARYGIDESTFFAKASSNVLDALRRGPKWAFKARLVLKSALQEPA